MTTWLRRLRGALGMGLTWAVGWALGGLAIGVASVLLPFIPWDAFFRVFDAPLPALALPGFIGGTLYSLVLGVAAHNRRFADLSLSRVTLWGGLGGLLLGLVPATMALLGLASGPNILAFTAVIIPPLTLMGAASAAATLAIARRAEGPGALPDGADDVRLTEGQAPRLPRPGA